MSYFAFKLSDSFQSTTIPMRSSPIRGNLTAYCACTASLSANSKLENQKPIRSTPVTANCREHYSSSDSVALSFPFKCRRQAALSSSSMAQTRGSMLGRPTRFSTWIEDGIGPAGVTSRC